MTNVHPKITATTATGEFLWTVTVLIEPGSVEDRLMQYSHGGKTYRPAKLFMSFRVGIKDSSADRIALGSGLLAAFRDDIALHGLSISGPRITSTGKVSVAEHIERFYGRSEDAPDWARFLIEATLNTLHGN